MKDSSGNTVKEAYPGDAVTISGWKTLPDVGDDVLEGSEAEVKKAFTNRERRRAMHSSLKDIEVINVVRREERERRALETALGEDTERPTLDTESGLVVLKLVVKADVSGSSEAIVAALEEIKNDKVTTKVISSGVGPVTESDIGLAKTAEGNLLFLSGLSTFFNRFV
jgi:translation initiation factor IF-2